MEPQTRLSHWLTGDCTAICREADLLRAGVERVIRSLDRIIEWRGKPGSIRVDNGPEYISEKLMKCKRCGAPTFLTSS